jgi:hypothetical protein
MLERSYRLKSQQNEGCVSDIYGLAWKLAECYILSGEFWSAATHEIVPMFNIRPSRFPSSKTASPAASLIPSSRT